MSANAIETLREKAGPYVATRFCDVDGVWHDGPHRAEFDDALAAMEALLEAAKAICAEPTTSGPDHDKATRVISYRALREILEPLVRRVETGQ